MVEPRPRLSIVSGDGVERQATWKPVVLVSLLSILLFGGLAVLTFVAPEGSRAAQWGVVGATFFAGTGLLCIVAGVVLLRPGSPFLSRYARLDQALKDLVGTPSTLFAATVVPSDRALFDQTTSMSLSPRSIVMLAVGPNGVAVGKAGRTPSTAILASGESDVAFALGGPGGGLFRPKSADTPTMKIDLDTPLGPLELIADSLVSPRAGTAMRDEREVRQLVAELTAIREPR